MPSAQASDSGSQDRAVPSARSRTWELELFISGATVFALLRAPAIVDRWYLHLRPHLAGDSSQVAFLAYFYAKLILYTLIATFLLHLVARAYWVALVGVQSVYPGGVRWDDLGYGPALLDAFSSRLPPLEQSIQRINNLSSLLFSGGAVVLLMFVMSMAIVAPVSVLAVGASHLLFHGRYVSHIVLALIYSIAAIPMIVRALDIRAARRGRRSGSHMRRAAWLSYFLNGTPVVGPLSLVLLSNLGRRRAVLATTAVLTMIVGTFFIRDVLLGRGDLRVDSHIYLPDGAALQESLPAHYAAQRDDNAVYSLTPFIQSDIVTEPYVRLFVPLSPQRHNPLVAERCPNLVQGPGGFRMAAGRRAAELPDVDAVITCLSSFQPVSLNGLPLHGLQWRLTTDHRSGLRGLQVLIPVLELAAGEHVLRVEALPRSRSERERSGRAAHVIRFWR